jgi:radical SAM superfamily enzyme YgiQ (UPF0313 family)
MVSFRELGAKPAASTRRKGLLLVPEFPFDSFWSYRYVMRLIGRKAAFPPLGLLTFAGYLTPDEWDVELIDLNVRVPTYRELRRKLRAADVAFVSAMSIQKKSLVEILRAGRGLRTPVVLGGPFASSYRDQILHPTTESDQLLHEGLDMLVWGEAQNSIEELRAWLDTRPAHAAGAPRLLIPDTVAAADPGSRRYLNDRAIFKPLEVPLPRWELVNVHDYRSLMVQTTAGCPFRCDFCDIVQFNGGFSRPKAPSAVRRELEAILATGYRGSLFSVDDNFIGNPAGISAILDDVIEFQREHDYPFTFYTQASVNLGTPELAHLLEKMKLAGFDAVFLGIENPDPAALMRMNKKQNIKVDIPAAVAAVQRSGIEVYAGFIFGTDEDTPGTAQRIVDFVKSTRIFTAMAGMLTPVPHTPLYERLRAEGRLRPAEYSGNNTDDEIQFQPQAMDSTEMRTGIHEILYRLFNAQESYRRALDMLSAVRPHIFSTRRIRLGELKAAWVSFWTQGVARLDRHYFLFLYRAWKIDREITRAARAEKRRMRRDVRAGALAAVSAQGRARLERWIGFAHDYRVRFRPEAKLTAVRARASELRERLNTGGLLSADELRPVYQHAASYLRVQVRRHRFPGMTFTRAIEAAVKGLHYEKVMSNIVGARAYRRPRPSASP